MYTSFRNAKEGDTTFYTGSYPIPECRASMIYVDHKVYKLSQYHGYDNMSRLVGCDNPKLEFMKELEPKETTIYHNGEEEYGALRIDGGLWGAEPLNIERDKEGKLHQFKYQGNIRVGNNVHMGNNVTIARGALGDTIIEDNVMMDTNVFIGNEAHIGYGSVLCVGVIVGGGARIGRDCFIGLGAIINPHIKIGNNSIVGSGSVVINNIEDKEVVVGNPAGHIPPNNKILYKMVGLS